MQVQRTNDSSIVSKLSSSKRGYFEDKWLTTFVKKFQRRSPIINRGYYIRFKAMEATFKSWFALVSSMQSENSQIISLGAGFDTTYFRLKNTKQLPAGCKYIEVDYPEVMKKKLECIINSELSDCLQYMSLEEAKRCPYLVASNGEYSMLGLDLKNYEELGSSFKALLVDNSVPTLFISECAVTYMNVKSSNGLIEWIQNHFPNSAFVTYEQVSPNDGFGIVMQDHFESLSCPLKSLPTYPDKHSQYLRYTQMGWSSCSSISMFHFFMSFEDDEKCRIRCLEMFDEYEMWHEKCHHYLLIWASQGTVQTPEMFHVKNSICSYTESIKPNVDWKLMTNPIWLQRFGHQVALLSPRFLLVSGGFGHLEKKHQRVGGLVQYDLTFTTCNTALLSDPLDLLAKRMFHSMTSLSNGRVVVLGGRSSPSNIFRSVVEIQWENMHSINEEYCCSHEDVLSFTVEHKTDMPLPTWRHSASLIEIEGIETVLLFGGCSSKNNATNNCSLLNTETWKWLEPTALIIANNATDSYSLLNTETWKWAKPTALSIENNATDTCSLLNTETWKWSSVPQQQDTPSPRHSHSSVSISKSKVAITCGLSKNEDILNSVHVFDSQYSKWSTLIIPGLVPRYSHTSHFWNNHVFLVGGITSLSGYSLGLGMVDLDSLTAIEFSYPAQDPEYPILLSNHCSYIYEDQIIISGGGGNCFSFGTHFNERNVKIDLQILSLQNTKS